MNLSIQSDDFANYFTEHKKELIISSFFFIVTPPKSLKQVALFLWIITK